MGKRTLNLDTCDRMFMVFAPSGAPVYWTACRRASDAVSTIAFKYGESWEELVGKGYESQFNQGISRTRA